MFLVFLLYSLWKLSVCTLLRCKQSQMVGDKLHKSWWVLGSWHCNKSMKHSFAQFVQCWIGKTPDNNSLFDWKSNRFTWCLIGSDLVNIDTFLQHDYTPIISSELIAGLPLVCTGSHTVCTDCALYVHVCDYCTCMSLCVIQCLWVCESVHVFVVCTCRCKNPWNKIEITAKHFHFGR